MTRAASVVDTPTIPKADVPPLIPVDNGTATANQTSTQSVPPLLPVEPVNNDENSNN